uniref:DNA-directed RNA polymerase III subunit n=1 Tax=Callorhinchus milii TaxID=7868 RepID=A0A4W3JDM8_CALMI|eukprot:gi/632951350/ref/XP_007891247.1/ PREDICTED: DNA-directed RNA polymerase III subunit RPC7 [Callorhinchus milii]
MAGKGRGRGRAQFTFNIEEIGFSRGESLPEIAFQPRPLFPPTDFKTVPLNTGEDVNYMLALKQELRGSSKKLPYFIEVATVKRDVERYTEKYQVKDPNKNWTPDWRLLPAELKPRTKKLKTKKVKKAKPSTKPAADSNIKKPTATVANEDVIQTLEALEKKDAEGKSDEETEEKEKDKDEEGEEAEVEEYNEEELEEENDYIASYFDDGGDYGVSDDEMDEATY